MKETSKRNDGNASMFYEDSSFFGNTVKHSGSVAPVINLKARYLNKFLGKRTFIVKNVF